MKKKNFEKCGKAGKCFLVCAAAMFLSGFWHGKAAAGEGKVGNFCLIVPPTKYKPAAESVRYAPAEPARGDLSRSGAVKSFFKGQMKKVGFGTPDCFRIDPEEAALRAVVEPDSQVRKARAAEAGSSSLFPGMGYFNRTSRDGRRGVAFGAGVGRTSAGPQEELGKPDAKVGIVLGFNF